MTVLTLMVNGRVMPGAKSYGATGSGANIIDDVHFSGTGHLRVKRPVGFAVSHLRQDVGDVGLVEG